MTGDDSIKSIEEKRGVSAPPQDNLPDDERWPLDDWYLHVYEKSFADYSDRDLGVAIRQRVYPESVVPVVIERLEADPTVGFGYDGELLESLNSLDNLFWDQHPDLKHRIRNITNSLPTDHSLQIEKLLEITTGGMNPE